MVNPFNRLVTVLTKFKIDSVKNRHCNLFSQMEIQGLKSGSFLPIVRNDGTLQVTSTFRHLTHYHEVSDIS